MIRSAARAPRILVGIAVLAGAAWALFQFGPSWLIGAGDLHRALTGRGRVGDFTSGPRRGLRPDGASLITADALPDVAHALAGSDVERLLAALERSRLDALLIEPVVPASTTSLRASLGSYRHIEGLRGLYLSREAALYGRDAVQEIAPLHREAVAVVARRLIAGARPPNVSSFPEPLRRVRPVEVMVLLRQRGRARLWRSARGSSIASALITAAVIARQRWQEREQAMGGPLDQWLPRLDVEVALLEEDGTLGERDPAFIDRVFFEGHGVGYERKGAWRYLLPDTTREEGKGQASRAYRKLFVDDGLPADSFERHELRLYRLMVQRVAVSAATATGDALSAVKNPDEVLGAGDSN